MRAKIWIKMKLSVSLECKQLHKPVYIFAIIKYPKWACPSLTLPSNCLMTSVKKLIIVKFVSVLKSSGCGSCLHSSVVWKKCLHNIYSLFINLIINVLLLRWDKWILLNLSAIFRKSSSCLPSHYRTILYGNLDQLSLPAVGTGLLNSNWLCVALIYIIYKIQPW